MRRLALPAAILGFLFLPVGGFPVAGYLRGIGGDLSVTTLLLLASTVVAYAGGPKLHERRELQTLAAFVLAGALFLYPMSLGLTSFDPYALGYPLRVRSLLLGLVPAGLFAWFRGGVLVPVALAAALAAFRFRLFESENLWDYLLDPWLTLYLAGFTIFARFSKSR